MSGPKRIQRKRAKGWRLPEGAVIVDRSSGYGNPYRIAVATEMSPNEGKKEWWIDSLGGSSVWRFETKAEAAEAAVKLYRHWLDHPAQSNFRDRVRLALRGKDLACWCPLPKDGEPDLCHAAVLLELANAPAPPAPDQPHD